MTRVFHLITTIERGGAENQLLILCEEQSKLGLDINVFYLKGLPSLEKEFKQIGVRVHRITGNPIRQLYRLRRFVKNSSVDILHAHLPRAELLASLAISGVPFVISRHNAERFLPNGPVFLSKILSRFVIKKSSARISISRYVDQFIQQSGESVKELPFSTIYYGYRFGEQKFRSRTSKREKLELITIGRLVPQKDYITLLTALSMLSKRNLQFGMVVLGEGPLESELKELARVLGIEDFVSWRGKVENVFDFLLDADFFILSSVYEGFGLVLLEAMDAEVPIICSKIPTFVELLGLEYSGFFSVQNPESLTQTLMFAQEHKNKLLSEMKSRKATFDAQNMANQVNALYKKVLLDSRN
jgi:glycosyltransferase involved in cell wall biosynthesis